MVNRYIKEPLNLVGMEIDGDDTVCSGCLQHVGYQFRADRDTGLIFAVLTRPAEIRDNGDHLGGTGSLSGVDHKEQLHQIVAGRTGWLHQVNVLSANGLLKIRTKLTV